MFENSMLKTISVLIGNSDDKLSQVEWNKFHSQVGSVINHHREEIFFSGSSEGSQPWQNACWVFSMHEEYLPTLKDRLNTLRVFFRQESVAITVADTQFI